MSKHKVTAQRQILESHINLSGFKFRVSGTIVGDRMEHGYLAAMGVVIVQLVVPFRPLVKRGHSGSGVLRRNHRFDEPPLYTCTYTCDMYISTRNIYIYIHRNVYVHICRSLFARRPVVFAIMASLWASLLVWGIVLTSSCLPQFLSCCRAKGI